VPRSERSGGAGGNFDGERHGADALVPALTPPRRPAPSSLAFSNAGREARGGEDEGVPDLGPGWALRCVRPEPPVRLRASHGYRRWSPHTGGHRSERSISGRREWLRMRRQVDQPSAQDRRPPRSRLLSRSRVLTTRTASARARLAPSKSSMTAIPPQRRAARIVAASPTCFIGESPSRRSRSRRVSIVCWLSSSLRSMGAAGQRAIVTFSRNVSCRRIFRAISSTTASVRCMRLPNPLHKVLHAGSSAKAKVSSGPVSKMRESFPGPADTVRRAGHRGRVRTAVARRHPRPSAS
jgi:hypothetical protein